MTDDIVTRIRTVFEDTPEVLSTLDVKTYAGAEAHTHMLGMWETMKEAADYIEELEFVLLFISNINYGNGPDVTMEHQGWAKRALGEKTDD